MQVLGALPSVCGMVEIPLRKSFPLSRKDFSLCGRGEGGGWCSERTGWVSAKIPEGKVSRCWRTRDVCESGAAVGIGKLFYGKNCRF